MGHRDHDGVTRVCTTQQVLLVVQLLVMLLVTEGVNAHTHYDGGDEPQVNVHKAQNDELIATVITKEYN